MHSKQGKTYCATIGRVATVNVILYKSVKLELPNDGRLRLVNKVWKRNLVYISLLKMFHLGGNFQIGRT